MIPGFGRTGFGRDNLPSFSGWWLPYPSEKYGSQLGVFFPIYGKIIQMFQPTNQYIYISHWADSIYIYIPIPSGNLLHDITIENGHRNSEFSHEKIWKMVDLSIITRFFGYHHFQTTPATPSASSNSTWACAFTWNAKRRIMFLTKVVRSMDWFHG